MANGVAPHRHERPPYPPARANGTIMTIIMTFADFVATFWNSIMNAMAFSFAVLRDGLRSRFRRPHHVIATEDEEAVLLPAPVERLSIERRRPEMKDEQVQFRAVDVDEWLEDVDEAWADLGGNNDDWFTTEEMDEDREWLRRVDGERMQE